MVGRRRIISAVVLTFALISVLDSSFNVQRIEALGIIRIKADGSIDPQDTSISTTDMITYYCAGDINGSIVVERDNIVLDGNGYTLQGDHSSNGINLFGRTNVTVRNTRIENFYCGIWLNSSNYTTINGNNVISNEYGIWFENLCYYSRISGNNISYSHGEETSGGIRLGGSSRNNISGNNIESNDYYGVRFHSSSDNSLSGNNITANGFYGIFLYSSSNNSITENGVMANNNRSIVISQSFGNRFYHNNFNNTQQVRSDSTNIWDNGYPSGGNYWSDYIDIDLFSGPYQNETGSDGIGDKTYSIDVNNTDNFPLAGMFSNFNTTLGHSIQAICNSTISDFHFNGTAICFDVSGENGTSGFCRISIPKALMASPYEVFINGTKIQSNLLSHSDSTYAYLYFDFTHSTKQVVIVLEYPSLLVSSLFIAVTMIAAIICERKRSAILNKQQRV